MCSPTTPLFLRLLARMALTVRGLFLSEACRGLPLRRQRLLFLVLFSSLASWTAWAGCDANVRALQTSYLKTGNLCDLQGRYRKALKTLKVKGVRNPERIGNLLAARFINKKDWTAYLAQHGDSESAAWRTYAPALVTWKNWAAAAATLSADDTKAVFKNGNVEEINRWILALHSQLMRSLLPPERVGRFRTDVAEIIPLHYIDNAYSADDIERIRHTFYVSPTTGKKLMNFELRSCINLDTTSTGFYFRAEDGTLRACGDLTMVHENEVLEQMDLWANYLRRGLQSLSRSPSEIDIIEFAATVQQWFVVIHPFVDGNGRTSRLLMDLVLNLSGLPSAILNDPNRDFFTTPKEWAQHVGDGLVNAVEAAENCAQDLTRPGCKEVSETEPVEARK